MIVMINDIPCLINDKSDLKHHLNQFIDVNVDELIEEAGLVEYDHTEIDNLSIQLNNLEDHLSESTGLLDEIRSTALNGMDTKNYEDALDQILDQTEEL